MDKFNETAYKNAYAKEKYTPCKLMLKPEELAQIEEYRQILGLSKNAFFIRCALYCAENDIRIEELHEIPPKSEFTFCILRSPLYIIPFKCKESLYYLY